MDSGTTQNLVVLPSLPTEKTVEALKGCTIVELKKNVEDLRLDIKRLNLENEVFENFLNRNEPSSIAGMKDVVEGALRIASNREELQRRTSQTSTITSPWLRERDASKKSIFESNARINFLQKFDLVAREVEYIQDGLEKCIAAYKRQKKHYNAETEEILIRMDETENHQQEFEKEVVGACSTLTHRIPAESFVRFMVHWCRSAELLLSKIRLNVSCHRQQYRKLKQIHFRRKPMFESVDEGDFIKLETEKVRMGATYAERNRLRKELKDVYSKSHLLVAETRKILQTKTRELTTLQNKIAKSKYETVQYDKAIGELDEDIERLQEKKQKVEVLIAKHDCPSPMDYIKSKQELFTLKQHLKRWRQRVRIQTEGLHCYTLLFAQKKKSRGSNSEEDSFDWFK